MPSPNPPRSPAPAHPGRDKRSAFRRHRRWFGIASCVGALTLAALFFARGPILRWTIQTVGSPLAGAVIRLDRIDLQPRRVRVAGLRLAEPGDGGEVWASVADIDIDLRPRGGWFDGVWIGAIKVDRPALTLRLDSDGQLLTRLPQLPPGGEPSTGPLPLASLIVRDASITIHQTGKPTFTLAGASLTGGFGRQIQIRGRLPDLLGGEATLWCDVDANTLAGQTRVQVRGLDLDTTCLACLPLVPAAVGREPAGGRLTASLELQHPPDQPDPRRHDGQLSLTVDRVETSRWGDPVGAVRVDADLADGVMTAAITARPIGGQLRLDATAKLIDDVSGDWRLRVADLTSENVLELIADGADAPTGGRAEVDASGDWQIVAGKFRQTHRGTARLGHLRVRDQSLADAVVDWQSEAALDLAKPRDVDGDVSVDVTLPTVDLATIRELTGRDDLSGTATATVRATFDLDRWETPVEAIDAALSAQTRSITAAGESIGDSDWRMSLSDGRWALSPVPIRWRDQLATLRAAGTVQPPAGEAAVEVLGMDLRRVGQAASRFSDTPLGLDGTADLRGRVTFNSVDRPEAYPTIRWDAAGSAALAGAVVLGRPIGGATLDWDADASGLRLHSRSRQWLGGRFDLAASIEQLDWTRTLVGLDWSGVPITRLAAMAGVDVPATGTLRGGLNVTSLASMDQLRGSAWVATSDASVFHVPVAIQRATVSIDGGELQTRVRGELAGGSVDATATGRLAAIENHLKLSRPPERLPVTGQLLVRDVSLRQLGVALPADSPARSVGGRVSATVVRDESMIAAGQWCRAEPSLRELQHRGQSVVDRLAATAHVHPDRVELTSVDGRSLGGRIGGDGLVTYVAPGRGGDPLAGLGGRVDLRIEQVDLRRAGVLAGRRDVSGRASVRLRGRLAGLATGTLDLQMDRVAAAGLVISSVRVPVRWTVQPSARTVRWQSRGGVISAGGGAVRLTTTGSYSRGVTGNVDLRIDGIDGGGLLPGGGAALGRIDGQVQLSARGAKAPDDIAGRFVFDLTQPQPMQLPVLNQLPTIASLTPPRPGRDTAGGHVAGRIARGVVRVDEASAYQSNVQVLASGTATMAGRLDVNLTASTQADGPIDSLLDLADSPLMLAAPAPVALVARANDLLKDRVVHAHIGGTASRPTIRLQPGRQLSQDAVAFFLRGTLGGRVADLAGPNSEPLKR